MPGYKPPHQEKPQSALVRGMLTQFVNPTNHNIDVALKTVLAAVAYVNMDSSALITTAPESSDIVFPTNKAISNGLRAALHFHRLQEKESQDLIISCVQSMYELQGQLYGMVEAIASIRARIRHNQLVNEASEAERVRLNTEYDAAIKSLGAGSLPAKTLGPLVAFLVGGFRGLLIFSKNEGRFGPLKVSYFLAVVNQLHQNQPVEEPIWKHSQSFILDLIESGLFPQGFEKALAEPQTIVNEDQWQHVNCNKMQLAKCIQMDLAEFCKNRKTLLGGLPYQHPEFDLPSSPVNRETPKKKQKKKPTMN